MSQVPRVLFLLLRILPSYLSIALTTSALFSLHSPQDRQHLLYFASAKKRKGTPKANIKIVTKQNRYLILGGTGVRSAATTELLLHKGHLVTLLNRGSAYWDAKERLLSHPSVTHWNCDREKKLQNCKPLIEADDESDAPNQKLFAACIDFTSAKWEAFENAKQYLEDKCGFYIFISSYKVYEVSGFIPKLTKKFTSEKKIRETMMKRPNKSVSPLERHEIIEANPIGHEVFQVEEALEKNFDKGGVPYTVLRAGNMIGKKESIMRFWFLQLWLHGHTFLGMPMHITSTLPMSLTYNYDLAQAIAQVLKLQSNSTTAEQVIGEAFNVGCEETKDQYGLFYAIGDAIGLSKVDRVEQNSTKSVVLYPENKPGHTVNVEKAKRVLGFKPTNLDKAIRETALFYEQAMQGDRWKVQRKVAFESIAQMMDSRKLVDWVEKYMKEEKRSLYDDYDEEEFQEELAEKFKRMEL